MPIFFVTTGLRYDLHALITSKLALLQLPMFLTLFLVIRGLPALLIQTISSTLPTSFFSWLTAFATSCGYACSPWQPRS